MLRIACVNCSRATDDCIAWANGKVGNIKTLLIVQEVYTDGCIDLWNGKVGDIKIVSMGEVWQ